MARLKLQINEETLLEKRGLKKSIKEISNEMGISTATLSRRIAELENKEGILTKYRELQGLQLTSLQFRTLQAISPEMIATASLTELVRCFSILNKVQSSTISTRSLNVTGLVQYLIELEQHDSITNHL